MSVTEIDALVDRLDHEDPDLFLGKIFWYSFADVRVPHSMLIRFLVEAGITKNLPLVPDDVDVFKRVATSVKRMKVPFRAGVTANYYLPAHREFRDDVSVTRRIVRETVDSKGRKLDFLEVADLVFDRKSGVLAPQEVHVDGQGTTPIDVPTAEIIEEVIATYESARGCLNTYGVREWVRGFITRLGVTPMRPGGALYFVKMQHSDMLERLEKFAGLVSDADCGQIEFESVPLVDDRKQRLLVQQAFEAETAGAIDKKLEEIASLAGSEKALTSERYAQLMDEFQALTAKTMDYETLLQDKLQATDARLKIYRKSLVNLMGKVQT